MGIVALLVMSASLSVATEGASQISSRHVEEKDQHGNLIMSLKDIGLDASIRYAKYEDGVRLAQVDIVKAVTGKKSEHAGNTQRHVSRNVFTKEDTTFWGDLVRTSY